MQQWGFRDDPAGPLWTPPVDHGDHAKDRIAMLYGAISGGTVGKLKQVVGAAIRHRRAVTADGLRPFQRLLDFRLRIVRHAVIFIAPTTAVYRPTCHRSRFLEQWCDAAYTTLCSRGQDSSNTAPRHPAYDGRSSRAHAPDRRGAAC